MVCIKMEESFQIWISSLDRLGRKIVWDRDKKCRDSLGVE